MSRKSLDIRRGCWKILYVRFIASEKVMMTYSGAMSLILFSKIAFASHRERLKLPVFSFPTRNVFSLALQGVRVFKGWLELPWFAALAAVGISFPAFGTSCKSSLKGTMDTIDYLISFIAFATRSLQLSYFFVPETFDSVEFFSHFFTSFHVESWRILTDAIIAHRANCSLDCS